MMVSSDLAKNVIQVEARIRSTDDALKLINALAAAANFLYDEQIVLGSADEEAEDAEVVELTQRDAA